MYTPDSQVSSPRRHGLLRVRRRAVVLLTALLAGIGGAAAGTWVVPGTPPALGRAVSPAGIGPGRSAVFPDGQGLPVGQGLAAEGAGIYARQCASCHGRHGEGATAPELIGGDGPLSSPGADKTLLTYWPFATTLFDTIRRGMPPTAPDALSDAEVYAVCAWLLSENRLWAPGQPLDGAGLAGIRMPNRDGFRSPPAP